MSVVKRSNRSGSVRWDARIVRHGREVRKSFQSKAEAIEYEARVRAGQDRREDRSTLDSFARDSYWPDYARVELSPKTREVYAAVYNGHISPAIGHLRLAEVDGGTVQAFKAALDKAGVGEPTQAKALGILSGIYAHALRCGKVGSNPVGSVKWPKARRSHRVEILTPEWIEKLRVQFTKPDERLLVSLIAYVGLRPHEAMALEWADVARETIRVQDGKTGERVARIWWPAIAAELAEAEAHSEGRSLFPGWTEDKWRNFRKRKFKPAAEAIGSPDLRPYDLRHAQGSLALRSGLDALQVARSLGHSLRTLDRHYAQTIAEMAGSAPIDMDAEISDARRNFLANSWQT